MKTLYIYLFALLLLPYIASAQEITDSTKLNLPTEEIQVIKAFEARLADAKQVQINPSLPQLDLEPKRYDYDVTIIPLDIEYTKPIIRPLAMKPSSIEEYNKAWARLGFSSLKAPYLHGGYTHTIDNENFVGGEILHQGGENDHPFLRKYTQNQLKINGAYNLESIALYGDLNTNLISRYLNPGDSLVIYPEESIKRNINDVGLNIGLRNKDINDSNIHFDINPFIYLTSINTDNLKEINTGVDAKSVKHIGDTQAFILNGNLSYTSVNQDSIDANLSIGFNPKFIFNTGNLSLEGGLDYLYDGGDHYPWPNAKIEYRINNEQLSVFIGSNQRSVKNSFRNISNLNPYINTQLDSINNQVDQNIFAGASGNLYNTIRYEGKAGYRISSNRLLFLNSTEDIRLFDPLMSDINSVYIEATIEYQLFDFLAIDGQINQQFFNLDEGEEAWHLPSLLLTGGLSLIDAENQKYRVRTTLTMADRTTYLTPELNVEKTNAQVDLSIDAEYFFTEHIGLFLQANNLFNNKYERWNSYPGFGIHVIGGASLKF